MKTILQETFYILGSIAIFGFILMIVLSMYWTYASYQISDYLEWKTDRNVILNPNHEIRGGETIRWAVDSVIKKHMTVTTSRFIQSDDPGCDFKILPTTTMIIEPGTRTYTNVSYIVPEGFKPCTYYVHLVSTVQVNPKRTIEFTRDTEKFTVIP